ncbi:hypothetical protein QYF61_001445 [Mycteria americana]|uniref:Uncharacterized protein n=1 Tax=Mycteria americana TaxID=33587 RepID=A0AAN7S550_MYCAM|nr:hypothetical protein QYF61_001445 [Mycteria americana]
MVQRTVFCKESKNWYDFHLYGKSNYKMPKDAKDQQLMNRRLLPTLSLWLLDFKHQKYMSGNIKHYYKIRPRHFNLSSLIHLLVVLMFFSVLTLGYMSIYVTNFYNQVLYLGSNILPQCGSPDGGPRILCIPDSKTPGVDLKSPLVLSARGSRSRDLVFPLRVLNSVEQDSGWGLNHFPGQPVPMLDNPVSEEIFPNTQSKRPLVQLETASSYPIACYLGEETDPHLSTTSFQTSALDPSPASLPFSGHAPAPQCLSCSEGPKTEHSIQGVVSPVPSTGDNHFPTPAGHTIPDTSQDAVGLLGHLGILPAHVQLAVDQHPQVLFHQAAFQPLFPKPVTLHGVAVTQVQDPALSLVEPHTIGLGPSIQPVQIPLEGKAFLPSSRSTLLPNLVLSANLLRVHSIPSSRSLIKMLNRTGPNTEPRGTPLVTDRQLGLTPFTTTLWAQPSSQSFAQRSVHPSKP